MNSLQISGIMSDSLTAQKAYSSGVGKIVLIVLKFLTSSALSESESDS